MTNITHTPGPWRITTDFIGVYDSEARRIANLDSDGAPDFDVDETLANARLIAAAPELLVALEEMVAAFGWQAPNANPTVETAVATAWKAIAKAKGGAS